MATRGTTYDAAETYAELIEARYAPIAEALLGIARPRATDDVLEVGAGTGLVTRMVAASVRSIVATDLSIPMLTQARQSLGRGQNATFAVVDYGEPLPFLDESFSLVLSGLTYVQNTPASLRETLRVLKPNGRLALSMWGASYHEKQIMDAALTSLGGGRFPGAAPGRALRRVEQAGFRDVRRRDIDLTNRFASVADYIAYRRGFGRPTVWTKAYYERFLRALGAEASKTASSDGAVEISWTLTLLSGRR